MGLAVPTGVARDGDGVEMGIGGMVSTEGVGAGEEDGCGTGVGPVGRRVTGRADDGAGVPTLLLGAAVDGCAGTGAGVVGTPFGAPVVGSTGGEVGHWVSGRPVVGTRG